MKRLAVFCLLICILTACGPSQQSVSAEVEFWGLNAEVLEIDTENSILFVKGLDADSVLGERCALDCSVALENARVFYVKYDSDETARVLSLSDLLVGDKVTITLVESEAENAKENAAAVAAQVQLGTQRLN